LVLAGTSNNDDNNDNGSYTDPTNYLTPVGTFLACPGPYGTYDMGGAVWQWNETALEPGAARGIGGGAFDGSSGIQSTSYRSQCNPIGEHDDLGFRFASSVAVPEPNSNALVLAGAVALGTWRLRRRASRIRDAMMNRKLSLMILAALLASAVSAQADVFNMPSGQTSLQFVTVGNPGNAPDTALMTDGTTGYGSVPYVYQMGKYDVTVGQYCQFLNAVAKTDPYGLYNSNMATDYATIKLIQSGSPSSYSYSVTGSYSQAANCPIFPVTWGDAARFCNWLQNGQPTGPEGSGTTETGAYALNGAMTDAALMAVPSPAHTGTGAATYFLPSENEWYKAAYYSGGGTNSSYWLYPTQSNTEPSNVLSPTGTNNANYYNYYNSSYTDPTNDLTPVGSFVLSPGPYGTYDMGGDVWQWSETNRAGLWRIVRGGSWDYTPNTLASSFHGTLNPTNDDNDRGFRVVASEAVPEPASLALLLAGAVALGIWRLRRKACYSAT
jgi:formylglycine-generating enzyme required for sulfatase activity